MKAIELRHFGGPEALELIERPRPVPGPGELLVRVEAAGINYFETLILRDRYAVTPTLPMVPGVEACGIVEAMGSSAHGHEVGGRVAVPLFALGRGSDGYSEYVTVEAGGAVPVPLGVSPAVATALMVQGLTAYHLARHSPVKGRKVLVTAAAGGVGTLLLQLLRREGARQVLAAAGSQAKIELAERLGADAGFNYSEEGWHDRVLAATEGVGADLVYDLVGGAQTEGLARTLAPGGEIVFAALGRFDLSSSALEGMFGHNQSIRGFALLPVLRPGAWQEELRSLFERVREGDLIVPKPAEYPLARAADAHRAMEGRQSRGKIVLVAG